MENTNTLFDTWMEAQNKMTKNWVEMNEKMQKTMIGGEMLEKGSDLYKEWLQNQKTVVENLMGQPAAGINSKTADKGENASSADFFQNWLTLQNQSALSIMDASRKFYENMLKAQNGNANPWENISTMQHNWMNNFNNMFSGMSKAINEMPKFMDPAGNKEIFDNMMKSATMYNKMYEMMQPFFQNMPKGGFDAETMKKMFDPTAYKTLIDQMFGLNPTNNLTEVFEQTSKAISNWFKNNRQMGDSFMNAFGKERDLLEGFMPSGSSYMTEMYRNMFNTFRQSMMPFFRIASPGNEQDQMDMMFDMQEKLVNYNIKQNEMQYLIYTNAAKAWNEVLNLLNTRASEGKEYNNFQDFYAEWTDVNEKIFIELFSTNEFSRLQGDLLSLGLDLKKGFEKQLEAVMEPYPVVLKSQMDEVYRNNYELRKELRDLKKTVKTMQKSMKPAATGNSNGSATDNKTTKPAATAPAAKK